MSRPALLVSSERLASALAVWPHRARLGRAVPEVHVIAAGRFLSAAEALPLAPALAEGLDYAGSFLDALGQNRLSFVLPLLERTDGAVQGMLEFVGVPYAGCGMTGAILAAHAQRGRAVLDSLGLYRAAAGTMAAVQVAVLGNDAPQTGEAPPDAAEFCRRVYRGLGLAGWALIGVAPADDGWVWTGVEVQPDLGPESPFLRSLGPSEGLSAVLDRLVGWGQERHKAESGLKSLFKDKI